MACIDDNCNLWSIICWDVLFRIMLNIIMYFCLFFGGMGDGGYSEDTTDVDENEKIEEMPRRISILLEDPNDVGVTKGQHLWEDINSF